MLELVGDGHADQQEVGAIGVGDVLEHRPVAGGPVEALLDVGLLADDAGLENGEVRGGGGRELGCEELVELGVPGLARPGRPAGVRAGDRGVEQAHAGEVGRQLLDPDQHPGGLAVQGATVDRDLDVGPLALGEVTHGVVAVLGRGEQDAVVVGGPVVRAVVQVRVQAVLVDPEVEHPQPHLHRRAVGVGYVGPARRRSRVGAGERRLAAEAVRVVELQPERRDEAGVVEEHVVGPADEVGGHAAAGEEAPEVDRRPLDRGVAASCPLHLGDLEAVPLGGLGDRLGLQHAGVEGTRRGSRTGRRSCGTCCWSSRGRRARHRWPASTSRSPCSAAPG